jgi:hypothetical protein
MDLADPILIYMYIREAVEIDPVAMYNNLVDLPLFLTGPEVTTIVIGVTPPQRITEVADFVTARMAHDEAFFESPFLPSATVQIDPCRGTPRALVFGHLEWSIRVVIPTPPPPPDHLPQELCELVERVGPCLGVGLEEQVTRLNYLLLQFTGRTLPIDAAPPMDGILRELFPPQVLPSIRERRCHGG